MNKCNDKNIKLITKSTNIKYLLGYNFEGYILLCGDDFLFFTDSRYYEEAKKIYKNKVINSHNNYLNSVFKYLNDNKIVALYFERSISYNSFLTLKKLARKNNIKLISEENIIEKKRMVKSQNELMKIRKSAQINDLIFKEVLKDIELGVTELYLKNRLEYYLRMYGGNKSSFELIVLFGKRTSMPHGFSSDKKLERDMPILFDIGVEYQEYCSDMTRMVYFGKPDAGFLEDYYYLQDIQAKALDMVKGGVPCKDIDAMVRNDLSAKKIDILHSTGHGVGMDIHEGPFININSQDKLEANMVITIEPGIYFPNKYGIRIEDLVVVNNNGYELLSKTNKDIIVI